MALQLATRSSKSLYLLVVAVPLVLMCLPVAVAAASASAAAASSGQYRPSYGDTYVTCIPVAACDDNGCATRCRDLGYNPGSACWTSKDIKLYCCCGHGRRLPSFA
uniref:Knottin scorpion toxin-like domain-containing protein n=1 Tax=Oryza meridionalis TaxID=40149 RepID=A0A0E0F350_9ORYZ